MLAKLPIRGIDKYGSGYFGVSRDGGRRKHNGVDYACAPETEIYAPVSGRVTKLGYPYSDDLSYRYVQVTDCDGLDHRVLYCEPSVKMGDDVMAGVTVIGKAQDVTRRYPNGMTNHCHYEIKSGRNYINPLDQA